MPSNRLHPTDPAEILNSRRIGDAINTLAEPGENSQSAIPLDEAERDTIRKALDQSSHPLAGFAHTLLDQWEHLEADDQVAGLLLFSELVRSREKERNLDRSRGLQR